MINHELSEPERDPFLDGLSLGVWDEKFGYYLPKSCEVSNRFELIVALHSLCQYLKRDKGN